MNIKNQLKFKTRSDTKGMASAILEINEIFDNNGLFFWLSYGGLLGIIREGKLIPWNNDLEVCSWYKDINNDQIIKIVDQINEMGYTCIYYESFGTINIKQGDLIDININFCWLDGDKVIRPHETASKDKNNFFAHIFYWLSASVFIYPNTINKFRFKEENKQINYKNLSKFLVAWLSNIFPLKMKIIIFKSFIWLSKKSGGRFQKTAMPLNLFKEFKLYPFYNSSIYVPNKPERVLEFIYGREWKIPKDKWQFYDKENLSITRIEIIDEQFNYDHCGRS